MPSEIYLVKVGMTMTEGSIEEWYAADGATIGEGEMLYRLETEKVNMDVDADAAGTVKHIIAEGTVCEPGDVIGYIYASDETIPDTLPVPEKRAGEEVTITEVPASAKREPRARRSDETRVAASPAARRRARELNVDLSSIQGTGPRGRITTEDVESAPRSSTADERGKLIEVRGMRRTIAQRMHESLQSAAQLTMEMEACMDAAVALRDTLVDQWEAEGLRPTYTDLVIASVARALRDHPLINSEFRKTQIFLHDAIHVGMAVALDEGLVVPVIRDADALNLRALTHESSRLSTAARDGTLTLDDVSGGTFTVTALGMLGVDSFTPILNLPQAGILGVNRIYDGVGWEGDTPVRRKMMRLSLTWDHRVLDGAPAARFLQRVCELLESADWQE
ncbi:MAG: dihydrolipoamide acetyltransferase family protein [Gammaproteobacteria bacterium]|nr:dihydrolipoamide acetyltransferase family protein [Gammaproteobacteria bacterium]